MKIGFDAKRAIQNNTGLGNYSRYIIEILSEFHKENHYVLFAPKKRNNTRLETLNKRKNISFFYPTKLWKKIPSIWRSFGIKKDIRKEDILIFHGLSNELPFGIRKTGVKSIVSLHDLIFLRYPEYYKPIDRLIYKYKFGYACKKADKIIAISECTKRDIINSFNIDPKKIDVVYQGCHPNFGKIVSEQKRVEVIAKYKLPSNFILFVGSIESRKNLLLIVKALNLLDQNIHLVAIGRKTAYQTRVEEFVNKNSLNKRVHIYNSLPFEDLPTCYQLAKLFVYPSFFEGFGIPIIEALSSKIPVIAAKGSCLEEAGGEGALYVDPCDEKELAETIITILSDKSLAQSLIERGQKHIAQFSDQNIANKIVAVYESVLQDYKNEF